MLQTAFMATFVPCDRSQAFLLPPDLKEWLPGDDLAHFIVAAVERVPLASFKVNPQAGGRPIWRINQRENRIASFRIAPEPRLG